MDSAAVLIFGMVILFCICWALSCLAVLMHRASKFAFHPHVEEKESISFWKVALFLALGASTVIGGIVMLMEVLQNS